MATHEYDPYTVNKPTEALDLQATGRIADEVCKAMRLRIEELETQNALLRREIDQAQEILRAHQLPPSLVGLQGTVMARANLP